MPPPTAPSSPQVESTSSTTATVYWVDNSSDETGFEVERSATGGGSGFSLIGTAAADAEFYQDSGLTEATRYWYRVRAVNGSGNSAYTDEVNVTTQTCGGQTSPAPGVTLPRVTAISDPADYVVAINDMATQIEQQLDGSGAANSGECSACPTNGAVVLDLSQCCSHNVLMDQDINSISIINPGACNDGTINISIDDGETWTLGGWPGGFGFENNVPPVSLTGGPGGSQYQIPYNNQRSGSPFNPTMEPVANAMRGAGRAKSPERGTPLTLTCTPSTCSMDCGSTKSLSLAVTGGVAPYTWTVTGGTLASSTGASNTLTPPTNSGSGEGGTAYMVGCNDQFDAGGSCEIVFAKNFRGCNDQLLSTSAGNGCATCNGSPASVQLGDCSSFGSSVACGDPPCTGCGGNKGAGTCNPMVGGCLEDQRTGSQITAGCNPCGVAMHGKVVTVTDARGVQVSKTVVV